MYLFTPLLDVLGKKTFNFSPHPVLNVLEARNEKKIPLLIFFGPVLYSEENYYRILLK